MQINRKGGRDDGGYADLPPAFGEEQANRFEGEAVVHGRLGVANGNGGPGQPVTVKAHPTVLRTVFRENLPGGTVENVGG